MGTKELAIKLYNRWRKRIFANDDVSYRPAKEEGFWEVVITRGDHEFLVTLSPTGYQNPRLMLDADETMRFALKTKTT